MGLKGGSVMTEKYSRSQRRADRKRIIKKRQYHWSYGLKDNWDRHTERGEICFMPAATAGMIARTPKLCSCWMCGNPRKTLIDGSSLTMQERKALEDYENQLDDHAWGYQDWQDWWYNYADNDWWDEWSHQDTLTINKLKWKYCSGLTDEEYMWKLLGADFAC